MKNEKGKLYYGLGLDNAQLRADASESRNIIKGIGDTSAAEGARIDNTYRKIAGTVAAVFTVQQAAAFAQSIVQVRGEFQKLETSLSVLLQSKDKANAMMADVVRLAATTPFSLQNVAAGSKQLLAYGIAADDVVGDLRRLGDVAAGLGLPMERLTYLYGTTMTQGRLYTRDLLQFTTSGIPLLQALADMFEVSTAEVFKLVEAGSVGFPEVKQAIVRMTSEGGQFANMMEELSRTIPGEIEKLKDSIDVMFNKMGKSQEGFIKDAISGAAYLVEHYEDVGEALAAIVATYGTYKAAIMATEAVRQSIATVKRTEEASELMKLLSLEQQSKISKLGLAKTSSEYAAAVKTEVAAEMERQTELAMAANAEIAVSNKRLANREAEKNAAAANVAAKRAELETIIASAITEQNAALQKKMAIESEKQSRAALNVVKLQDRKEAAITQAQHLKEIGASREKIAIKNKEIATINNKIIAAQNEEIQHSRNVVAYRKEIAATTESVQSKSVLKAQTSLQTAQEQLNTASVARNTAARELSSKKAVLDSAVRKANTIETGVNTAAQTANATAAGFLSVAKTRLTAVAAKLNAVIMANPYALAAAAVIALAYGIYKLSTYQTDAEKAQTKLNDAIKETNKNIDSEVHQIDSMFARLKNAKQGTDEYRAAKEAIMNRYGEYLKKLGDEKTALNDVAAAYKLITEEAKKAARARAMESFTKEASDTLAEEEGESKDEVKELLEKKYKGAKGSDGISLSETYYWKIKPVIEGEADITPEIAKILKEFDKTKNVMVGIGANEAPIYEQIVVNDIKDQINKAAKARGVYNKVMSEAQMKFGENPSTDAGKKPAFDATTASLQQLMEQLPKAKDELEALKKAEKPDPTAIAAKEQDIQQIKDQTAAREKSTTAIKDVKAQIELLQKEQEKYGKDDAEYKALETRIKSLKTKLPKTEGQENKTETDAARVKRETAERTQKIKEYEVAVKKQVKQSELDIAQARIDAMEDGYAKEQAQNDLAYQRLILANQERETQMVKALQDARELEWENKNPKAKAKGETFDRSSVTAADLSPEQKNQLTEFYNVAEGIRDKANRDSLEQMLDDFTTYEQQRNKITEDYEKKRKSMKNEDGSFKAGFTQGNEDELNRNEGEALKAVDETFAMREDTFQAWMNAVSNMTLKQLERVLTQAEQDLKNLEKSGGADSKQIAVARAKVNTARTKVSKAKADNDVSPGKRSIKEWEDLYKTLQEAEREFESIGTAVGGVAGEIIGTAGTVLTSTLSMINGIVTLTTTSTTGMQASALASSAAIQTVEKASVILTIISAAMQIAMTIINLFNNDEEYQKEIEKLQGRIEQLQWELDNADAIRLQNNTFNALQKVKEVYAEATREVLKLHAANNKYGDAMYLMFGRAIYQNEIMEKSAKKLATAYANISYTADKALGSEKFSGAREQLENLAQQQLLIQEQINKEGSKKKTDHNQIAEWERQIQELGEEANKIINEIVEGIIGGSASDIAAELGDAFIDAFQNGEDAAEAWGTKVNEIVANVMKRMLVSKFLEEPLGEIFDKYKAKWYKDGEFAGIDAIMDSMGGFANDLNAVGSEFQTIWENLPEDVKNMFAPTDEAREASERGIATASQESVDENNGRLTAIQGHTYLLAENSKILVANSNRVLDHLAGIEDNTKSLSRLEQIETGVKELKNSIDDIALKGIKIK